MNSVLLKNAQIILENELIKKGYLHIEGNIIKDFGSVDELPLSKDFTEVWEFTGEEIIVPGFIDVHIHGAGGADTMDGTHEALSTIASVLPSEGTTSFLATTITQEKTLIEKAIDNVASYCKEENIPGKAEIVGIHLEGPFLNLKRAGAQPRNEIINPNIKLFSKWQTIANQFIKLVTLAPEKEKGIEFIQYLSKHEVISSIGHSDATYDVVERAVKAGATHVTHLFNGMRGLHHREPGVAGAALLFKELKAEMIADGIHVRPEMIRIALQGKGIDGILLITDAMRAKCLKNGNYNHGGQDVTVVNGKAVLSDGTLAGSILKMNKAIQNMIHFTDITLSNAVQLASTNPAKQINVFDRKGSIAIGKDADIVVLNKQLEVEMTFCRGIKAYHTERISWEFIENIYIG